MRTGADSRGGSEKPAREETNIPRFFTEKNQNQEKEGGKVMVPMPMPIMTTAVDFGKLQSGKVTG